MIHSAATDPKPRILWYDINIVLCTIAKFENWPESLEIFQHYKIVKSDNDERNRNCMPVWAHLTACFDFLNFKWCVFVSENNFLG